MIKLTSRGFFFFKVLWEGSVTGAGRAILPSPEDSATIPDLFSKVWRAEPTWRQHYRPLGGKKSDKFTRCSVGRKNGDTFCHVVPLRMLAQPRLHNPHPNTRRRKKTPHTGSEKEVSLQQLAVINPRQVRRWTHAFPVRPFKNKTTMRSVFPFNFMILPGVEG